jgi:hypothetical protein
MSATFTELNHQYSEDGVVIPSVTQCMQLAGLSDVSHIPYHVLETARARGEAVHQATELLDKDDLDLDSLDSQMVGYVLAYQKAKQEMGFTVRGIEQRGLGEYEDLRFGYCIDRVVELGDQLAILDLKTASRKQYEWDIQLAAYADGSRIDAVRIVLHLAKDGSYKAIPCNDINDFKVWRSALTVAHWRLAHGAKIK